MNRALLFLLAPAAFLVTPDASADPFRYVDREGRVHEISASGLPETPPVAPGPPPPATTEPTPLPPAPRFADDAADPPAAYGELAREAAELYSLPVELVLAVIKVESAFNARAVSRVGAMGLMQLMPQTAAELGVTNAFDPRQNVFGGVKLLRILVNTFEGQVSLALAAYNAGAGAVRRAGRIPPIVETQRYVASVLFFYKTMRSGAPKPLASR